MSREKVIQFCARLQGKASMREAAEEAEFTEEELDRLIEAMTIVLDRREDILAPDGGVDAEKLALFQDVLRPLEQKMDILAESLAEMLQIQGLIGRSIGTVLQILERANIRSRCIKAVDATVH